MSLYISKISGDDVNTLMNLNTIIFSDGINYPESYIKKLCKQKTGYIIYLDSKPAGYVLCDTVLNPFVKMNVPTVMSIGTLEDYRGMGFGRTLLTSSFELYPYQDIYLNVSENNPKAEQLYRSEGFIQIGTVPKYYKTLKGTENAYSMVRYASVSSHKKN